MKEIEVLLGNDLQDKCFEAFNHNITTSEPATSVINNVRIIICKDTTG